MHARPPSCSSRQDEAIDTDHAVIGAQTKPYAPPQVSPSERLPSTRHRRKLSSAVPAETDFCMPDCMEVQPALVDRLSCSLGVSINHLRVVSEHYLELSFVVGPLVGGECAPR
ncbi:hypothetical protein YC2023_037611 [Brassica napus]